MSIQNLKTTKVSILKLPFRNPEKKYHLDVGLWKVIKYIIGRIVVLPLKGCEHVKLMLKVIPTKFATPLTFNLL